MNRPLPREFRRALAAGVVSLAAATAACGRDEVPVQPTRWHEATDHRWRELAVPNGRPGFRSLSPSRTGISFANRISEERLLENQIRSNGSGVAIGDIDGDGLADVYFARLEGPNALYLNRGGWRFEEIAAAAGVDAPDRFSTGAVFADVDGDGDLDLLLTALGGPNALFENDGTGRFRDVTAHAGLESDRGSTTMALADVDGDGDLDLYVANYKRASVNDLFPPEERTMALTIERRGDTIAVAPGFRAHYEVEWRGNRLRRFQIGEPDRFYLNDGTGRFVESPLDGGRFLDDTGRPLVEAPPDWGLSARFQDLDGDGDPDLYVCNDFQSPDRIWMNDGDGTFRSLAPFAIRTTSASCMAADFSDVEGDGDLDIFAVDMRSRDPARSRASFPVVGLESGLPGEVATSQQVQRNVLLLDRGDGTYAEAAQYAGLDASGWSWSTLFLDVDLDGDEDLLIPNGHLHDVMDADTQIRLMNAVLEDWRQHLLFYRPLRLRNVAFRNDGGLRFVSVGEEWGFGTDEDISHGIATGDLDGDGDLDVIVNRMGDPALVLRNETGAPRVAVRLEGRAPNTQGIGSVIRVLGGAVPAQRKEVAAGGLYLSGSEPLYAFAAGDAERVTIVVEWRSGARSRIEDARPDRVYAIREPEPPTPGGETGGDSRHSAADDAPLFREVALDHLHVETPYDDFARQPLLPYRLSDMGPGVAWVDVDLDGDPDLVIGSGRGGTPTLFRNDDGRFARVVLTLPESPLDQSTVLELPTATGAPLILIGQLNYEAPDPETARKSPSVIGIALDPGRIRGEEVQPQLGAVVAGDRAGTGPMALADTDGDGDLDLFVGGRVVPAEYPTPADSRLLLDVGGRFAPDTANAAVFASLGLATSAVFSDIDGDGDPDLLVALEWGPIRVFVNEGGRFRDMTTAWGLASHTNRWNGLTTGDFDEDGRPDIVAVAWGLNTGERPTVEHPSRLYWGDLDANGTMDVVPAAWEATLGGYVPLSGFQRLGSALPFVRDELETFSRYARSTVEEALGPAAGRARILEAARLDHVLFLNRGQRFEPVPLPVEAQLAPAFHIGVADVDGDGHEDLFLAQNFSPTAPETERHIAGRGLLLRGDGEGGLEAVPGRESGIRIYGDQRGAAFADYDGDGRIDLIVTQNGAPARLFHNDGGAPGLRVRLAGPPANPYAVGAIVRLEYADGFGPAREVKAGSGHWSQDDPGQVLGLREAPRALLVRWPGGAETRHPVTPGAREIAVRAPDVVRR